MIHLNGNLLCAVDTETTGLDPNQHEIIQVAFIPLNSKCQPSDDYMPFEMKIKPECIDNIPADLKAKQAKLLATCINTGVDSYTAACLFDEWWDGLKLPERKRIVLLGHNITFDIPFLIKWLGAKNYDYRVFSQYRDTMTIALFLNDVADAQCEQYPFPKVSLRYCASQIGLMCDSIQFHDAFEDALTCAKLYAAQLRIPLYRGLTR